MINKAQLQEIRTAALLAESKLCVQLRRGDKITYHRFKGREAPMSGEVAGLTKRSGKEYVVIICDNQPYMTSAQKLSLSKNFIRQL